MNEKQTTRPSLSCPIGLSPTPAASLALVLLAGIAPAQDILRAMPIAGPVQDAGVYHVATGTWTRVRGTYGVLAQDALFRNDLPSGYFGLLDESEVAYDEGRLPAAGQPLDPPASLYTGTADAYTVTGVQFGYCALTANPVTYSASWFEGYVPCSDPASLTPVGSLVATGLPSGGCWIVAFDLSGTSLVFDIEAEGADGFWDDDPDQDSFGWSLNLDHDQGDGTGQQIAGPLLGGDNNLPVTYGDGTVFKNPGTAEGSGLGTQDLFWLISPIETDGCYFYGGCIPCASFHTVLFGEASDGDDDDDDCAIDCDTEPDDIFEDNDDCDNATPNQDDGIYCDLFVSSVDEDWYCLEVGPHKTLRLDIPHKMSRGDIDIELYSDCGGAPISSDLGDTDVPCIMWANLTDRTVTVYLRVFIDPTGPGECNRYKLKFERVCIECDSCQQDDDWEENDTIVEAKSLNTIPPGTKLTIQPGDDDWFDFEIGPHCWFNVAAFFPDECGDVQLALYGQSGGLPLVTSTGTQSLEFASWMNDSDTPATYRIQLWMEPGTGVCNSYDVLLTEDCPDGNGGPGTFCDTSPNSISPVGAILASQGGYLTSAAAFLVTDVPDQPGILYSGLNQIAFPFGCGQRCVGGNIVRYGPYFPSGSQLQVTVDMSPWPTNVNVQFWYRDPANFGACGEVFNLSNALTQ